MVVNLIKKKKGLKHAKNLFAYGANIVDVGGESTRPGSKSISGKEEWKRIEKIIRKISKKIPLSLDTRKADIMSKGIKNYSKTTFDDSVQFWQAGKGVGNIKSIETVSDVIKEFSQDW